jgi:Restriction endonuclease
MMGVSADKGKFLEELVGFLHKLGGGIDVKQNAYLPSIDGSGRKREIDVLLSIQPEALGDCPIYIPIECRNYGTRIGVDQIDGFFGKLDDIGIGPNLGIFVAASDYTSDALKRAASAGIKTLVAKGLTTERVALEINEVLHSVVFWVATWRDTNHFSYVPMDSGWTGSIAAKLPENRPWGIGALDAIWELWATGQIPNSIGEHIVYLTGRENEAAICTVDVTAHGACLPGWLKFASLSEAETGNIERGWIGAGLAAGIDKIQLEPFTDEAAMRASVNKSLVHLSVRAPRIVGPQIYWPPTDATAKRIQELVQAGKPVTFENVEGPNLLRAWTIPKVAVYARTI